MNKQLKLTARQLTALLWWMDSYPSKLTEVEQEKNILLLLVIKDLKLKFYRKSIERLDNFRFKIKTFECVALVQILKNQHAKHEETAMVLQSVFELVNHDKKILCVS